jgi:RNAse (barnase) inhibitor barstar
MFNKKYKVTILDSKWDVLKNEVYLDVIPRKEEYIFMNDQYYCVLNVIHMIYNNFNWFFNSREIIIVVDTNRLP